MNEIDLHGFTHDEAVFAVEDFVLKESTKYGFQCRVITGNSHKLQERIKKEILDKHGFNYYIPSWNVGEIIVS